MAAREMVPGTLELHAPAPRRAGTTARRGNRVRILALLSVDVVAFALAAIGAYHWSTQPLNFGTVAFVIVVTMGTYAAAGCYRPRAILPTGDERLKLITIPALVAISAACFELATNHPGAGDSAARLWLLMATLVGTGRLGVAG